MTSTETPAETATGFSGLGLSDKVVAAVADAGYANPTPIQAQAIPHAVGGKDVLGIAQTGTGKTASFVLPMLTRLEKGRARARMPRTLILEPTRELAAQVEENFVKYGKNHRLNVALLIGGVSFEDQDRKLQRGVDVLIATPGRLLDHFERGKLLLTGVEILVIDEADRMLDMGFIPDIERICKLIPFTRQTLFFSATMPPEITKLTEQFLHAPVRVEVSRPATAAATVTQRLVKSGPKDFHKRQALRNLISAEDAEIKNGIIFCNRKTTVSELFRSLTRHGFDAGALHGDMDQRARMAMLAGFRDGKLKLLVASDVAARGLDIPDVSHVFNYDVPIHAEDYIHRIGRTGRAGRSGKAFTIVSKSDTRHLDAIHKLTGNPIEWLDGDLSTVVLPEGEDSVDHKPRRGEKSTSRGRGERKPRAAKAVSDQPAAEDNAGDARPKRRERKPRGHSGEAAPGAEAVAESAAPAAPERAPRRERKHAIRDDNAQRAAAEPRHERPVGPRRDDRRHRDQREEPETRVGFGDDMPDFMKIAVRI